MFVVGDHAAPVYSLAFSPPPHPPSPSAGKDGTARLWDLAGGPAIVPQRSHRRSPQRRLFGPTASRSPPAARTATARLWGRGHRQRVAPPAPKPARTKGLCPQWAFLNGGPDAHQRRRQHRINAAEPGGGPALWPAEAPTRSQARRTAWGLDAGDPRRTARRFAWAGGGKQVKPLGNHPPGPPGLPRRSKPACWRSPSFRRRPKRWGRDRGLGPSGSGTPRTSRSRRRWSATRARVSSLAFSPGRQNAGERQLGTSG